MSRNEALTSLCALLLWIGGCPNRQATKSMVVYVPAKAPAATPAATSSTAEPQVLVIEEPAPPPKPEPEPEETSPPQTPEPTTQHHVKRTAPREATTEPDESAPPENPEPPPAEVPALEPRESSAQETELRRQCVKLEQDIQERIARLDAAQLSANNRKIVEDARTFSAQAAKAMASGDYPRALNLAHKASLLLAALE